VSIQHPATDQQETLLAQLDTGADISGIPRQIIDELRLIPARSILVEGYDGVCIRLSTYIVYFEMVGVRFRRLEAVPLPGEHALVGRDILNHFYARLNGPELTFELDTAPPTA
jgi:predicted aspartyl protease